MKYLTNERKTIVNEIDSILRWDSVNATRWEMFCWRLIRRAVICLTNK